MTSPTPRALIEGVVAEMTRKLHEPIQHGPCEHASDCPGHYGEVQWLGLKEARDTLTTALAGLVERPSPEQIEAVQQAFSAAEYIGGFYDDREPDEHVKQFRRECCDALAPLRALLSSWEGKEGGS